MNLNPLATPRVAQETLRPELLRFRQPITLVRLQSTATTILTTAADQDFEIGQLVVANVAGGAESLTLHLFATGGTAGAANEIADALVLAANTTAALTWAQGLVIPPSHTLQGLCGTNNNAHVFGSGWIVQGGEQ